MKKRHSLINPSFITLLIVAVIYVAFATGIVLFGIYQNEQTKTILIYFMAFIIIVVGLYLLLSPFLMIGDYIINRSRVETIEKGKAIKQFVFNALSTLIHFGFSTYYYIIFFIHKEFLNFFAFLFYSLAMILEFYILSNITEKDMKKVIKKHIICSFGTMILGIFMGFIIYHAITNRMIEYEPYYFVIILLIGLTIFKAVMAIKNFRRHHNNKSYLKLSLSVISIAFISFSSFVSIHAALFINGYIGSASSTEAEVIEILVFSSIPFALIIIIFSLIVAIKGIKDYVSITEDEEVITDETL